MAQTFCNEREDVKYDGHPRRSATSSTNENIKKIDKIIRYDRRLSVSATVEIVNIYRESICKIIVENLDMIKGCVKMVPKNSTLGQKFNRKEMYSDTLKIIKDDPFF